MISFPKGLGTTTVQLTATREYSVHPNSFQIANILATLVGHHGQSLIHSWYNLMFIMATVVGHPGQSLIYSWYNLIFIMA